MKYIYIYEELETCCSVYFINSLLKYVQLFSSVQLQNIYSPTTFDIYISSRRLKRIILVGHAGNEILLLVHESGQ